MKKRERGNKWRIDWFQPANLGPLVLSKGRIEWGWIMGQLNVFPMFSG